MKTPCSKEPSTRESVMTDVQRAVLDAATPDQLKAMRASISSRLRKTHGGGRPRKETAR
jgi:hypothetical protein